MEKGGPNVSIVAGTMSGYGFEVERTFFLGKVPEAARRPYNTMMQARKLAFEMVRPGVSMHDVDAAVNDLLRKSGYGEALLHRTGHGIGVSGHEGPFLAEGYHHEIRPGMIFTIEPGIYIEGIGGFRHSDTVLVTETGNVSLTPFPDSLEEMTLPIKGLSKLGLPNLQKSLLHLAARLSGIKLER
jgi:Xaa-Pro dipeptidase